MANSLECKDLKILKNTDEEDSDGENYVILSTEKTQEKKAERRKEKSRRMTTKSRALLDNLQEKNIFQF
jgi:hypothetical protein